MSPPSGKWAGLLQHIVTERVPEEVLLERKFEDIKRHCKTSDSCQKMSPLSGKWAGLLEHIVTEEVPASTLGVSFIGPLLKDTGVKHILITVDYTTRLVVVLDARVANGRVIQKFLRKQVIYRFRWIRALTTDQGTPFSSSVVEVLPAIPNQAQDDHAISSAGGRIGRASQHYASDYGVPIVATFGCIFLRSCSIGALQIPLKTSSKCKKRLAPKSREIVCLNRLKLE